MELSYSVMPPPSAAIGDVALACQRAGLHSIALADSPLIARELYVSCASCLTQTDSLNVITGVTNPLTRHPSVTASAIAALCELAPGRLQVGIATGDSAAWGAGLRPAKVSALRDYILAVKQLLRGEPATWEGNTFSAHWESYDPALAPPIYVACSGPKVLRMAVEVADGIIPAMGYAAENIDHVRRLVADACEVFDRDRRTFAVWWYGEFRFGPSADTVLQSHLGSDSQWLVMGSTEGKLIPPEYIPLLREMHADGHDLSTAYKDPDRGEKLVERAKTLGIYDWLYERAARLCGTPREIAARLQTFQDQGLDRWMLWQDGGEGDYRDSPAKLGEVVAEFDAMNRPVS